MYARNMQTLVDHLVKDGTTDPRPQDEITQRRDHHPRRQDRPRGDRQGAWDAQPAGRSQGRRRDPAVATVTTSTEALVDAHLHPRPRRLRRLRGGQQGADHAPHPAHVGRQRRPWRDRGGRDALVASTEGPPRQLALGLIGVILGTVNVVGGFVVTDRMLEMFERRPQGDERRRQGRRRMTTLQLVTFGVYLVGAITFILAPQVPRVAGPARRGNLLGARPACDPGRGLDHRHHRGPAERLVACPSGSWVGS